MITALRNPIRASANAKPRTAYDPTIVHKSNDRRHDVIRQVLFEAQPRKPVPQTAEDEARHEVIERAWKLFCDTQAKEREMASERKFAKMHDAFEELRHIDYPVFYSAAMKDNTLLFPRALKAPTETPSLKTWNYEFKHPEAATPKPSSS
ncbi:hypothetical protein IWQ60_012140 [Tieghemiomyces parasiticus]|uniref:Large ribosomal subunit protein mL40 n=1 Tax=Tieghemiomyces parasiticus TaxID=78921 RepID=A0A9W7ZFU6_9FUNG|nr:hypothetical protein IWQ60_012140 [Tieghemiomyces parasiticus]